MLIMWGPELITIYNDGFRSGFSSLNNHPAALGQPATVSWADIWPYAGPVIQTCMAGGRAEWIDGQKLPIPGNNPLGATYATFCFSPLADEGTINGVLVTCLEATQTLEFRHAYLLRLSDLLRPLIDPQVIQATAAQLLGKTLGANRVHYGEISQDGRSVMVTSNYVRGVIELTGEFVMADFGPAVVARLEAGQTIVMNDLTADPALSVAERAMNEQVGIRAQVGVPLRKAGQLIGILSVHDSLPRSWTPAEVQLIEETAERTWEAVERSRSETALRQREEKYRHLSVELENRVLARTQELLLANRDLQRSNDNLQQFAYVASHDLQEPLRKIRQFSSLLKQRYADTLDREGQDYLQRMSSASERMSTLIKDLLAYSRIATRQQSFGLVSLTDIVAGVLETLSWQLEERQVQLSVDELPQVKGDVSQLSQLFQNLISNAIKFTPLSRQPRIQIRYRPCPADELPTALKPAKHTDYYHQISLIDQGIGFDERYLDRIFQVFQRLHGNREFEGTGVGLAICQRVVENHGGALTAKSKPDEGATFIVYLPA
ncbi:signal transduction histidine kinase [Spirosoma lacussanchae]|uniref:sensor histidine kinase n=1 Tax=Spirosoma lacussanchae TaxID=1884249 RepID=UPI0014874A79|nr:ATP-binding protein [Spirosoma lacussanchae]